MSYSPSNQPTTALTHGNNLKELPFNFTPLLTLSISKIIPSYAVHTLPCQRCLQLEIQCYLLDPRMKSLSARVSTKRELVKTRLTLLDFIVFTQNESLLVFFKIENKRKEPKKRLFETLKICKLFFCFLAY